MQKIVKVFFWGGQDCIMNVPALRDKFLTEFRTICARRNKSSESLFIVFTQDSSERVANAGSGKEHGSI